MGETMHKGYETDKINKGRVRRNHTIDARTEWAHQIRSRVFLEGKRGVA